MRRHYDFDDSNTGAYQGAPRWVKILGLIMVVLVLLFIILQLTGIMGDHGPGRHLSFNDNGVRTPPSSAAKNYVTSDAPVVLTRLHAAR